MSCSVIQQTLQALFPLDSTLTISRVHDSGLSPGGNTTTTEAGLVTGGAEIWAQLWYDGVEQFYCQADQCIQEQQVLQAGNSSLWTCGNLKCTCIPGTDFCGATSSVRHISTPSWLTITLGIALDQPYFYYQFSLRSPHHRLRSRRNMRVQAISFTDALRRKRPPALLVLLWRMRTAVNHRPSVRYRHSLYCLY